MTNSSLSRLATYVLLLGLAVASVASGQLGIGIALAATKTLLVGLEYMELRHAHRVHVGAFVAWTVLMTIGLVVATR